MLLCQMPSQHREELCRVPVGKPQAWDNGKEDGNYYSILGLYWGYIGIMEKKMETTIALDPNAFFLQQAVSKFA